VKKRAYFHTLGASLRLYPFMVMDLHKHQAEVIIIIMLIYIMEQEGVGTIIGFLHGN